ncbi:hypothetical protein PIB19_12560 [Sphingomonas sp. 7/4-4]|uniref:hypothetical protein n=1 Tax=Sphingomonas sp. 7/4-4 TaxID=3018446 RepID=UPI0022F3874B|nr:hypothetical protein [Sphingomonas sp. 7/4-4]WBY06430.1 hypothetical protein PIB19_12560 [Sphingomonas sp. 7/4-4]
MALTAGTAIDAGGNRIQNVGAPVAGTDAANKDYVDTALTTVQGSVTTLSNTVASHETRITVVEAQNIQQDNRLTAVENTNTVQDNRLTSVENVNVAQDGRLTTVENTNIVQDTRLGAVETENVTQNIRLTSIENVNAGQDSRMTAIEAVNTIQANQISTLQDQVGDLRTSVTGLRRNIQEANGGIAAAVALGAPWSSLTAMYQCRSTWRPIAGNRAFRAPSSDAWHRRSISTQGSGDPPCAGRPPGASASASGCKR